MLSNSRTKLKSLLIPTHACFPCLSKRRKYARAGGVLYTLFLSRTYQLFLSHRIFSLQNLLPLSLLNLSLSHTHMNKHHCTNSFWTHKAFLFLFKTCRISFLIHLSILYLVKPFELSFFFFRFFSFICIFWTASSFISF